MAYAESVGIASFLQNLQQNLMANALRKQAIIDDERKIEAERAARAIDAGRLMFQPPMTDTIPIPQPLSLTGDLNSFIQTPPPGLGVPTAAPVPEIPKTRPLTLQEQRAVLSASRQGKEMPRGVTTVAPDIPGTEDLSKVTVDEKGGITKTYDILGKKKAADMKAYKDNYLKYQKMAVGARANDPSFKALTILQGQAYKTMNDIFATDNEKANALTDFERYTAQLEEIAPAGAREVPKPKPNPASAAEGPKPNPVIAKKIKTLQDQKIPNERIKADLTAKGIDPALYGL